ncbi:MAG: TonB-dependent receptor plug domain-containing protein [Bacteroidales bacterium]|nr:TonB-dependent receptor plug domain-containing protein [Bacteroidales bacterium]
MVTDNEGKYSILASKGSILVFSFVGMNEEEIVVGNETLIDISLVPEITQLDELIVVGYGKRKKSEINGSVATINSKDIESLPSTSFDEALKGMATGLYVSSNSGVPGSRVSMNIRGLSSISSGTDPLFIIDGVIIYSDQSGLERSSGSMTRVSPLATINPNDIESIQVLKDASATAIYGSRGANGVVLITTKQVQKEKGR